MTIHLEDSKLLPRPLRSRQTSMGLEIPDREALCSLNCARKEIEKKVIQSYTWSEQV